MANLCRVTYAPFSALFPRCRAGVHHGGIGTLSKALQAGLPQLIVQRAFDQFDNAARAVRLGFARTASYRQRGDVPEALKALLDDTAAAATAKELGQKLLAPIDIVPWLKRIAAQRPTSGGVGPER